MREFISFFVNGQKLEVRGHDAFLTLSDYLRTRMGMCGTKVVCSEGDCGSCTVLCGFSVLESKDTGRDNGELSGPSAPAAAGFEYRPIDSCIRFVFQLDGVHIVTVEGLSSEGERLNGVQQAMVDCHGSQCGFCTPGFVMAMTGLLQNNHSPSVSEIRYGLTGNLCRCTGYSPIIDAACQPDVSRDTDMNRLYPAAKLLSQTAPDQRQDPIRVRDTTSQPGTVFEVHCPNTVGQAVEILAKNPHCRVIAGATDLGVQFNKGRLEKANFIDLGRIAELADITANSNKIIVGAMVNWSTLEAATSQRMPQFSQIISVFGSPQIRNVGTIGGNLINASPIADSIPFLYICDATLNLTGPGGDRKIDIDQFYLDYKKLDLRPAELLTRIEIPLPKFPKALRLYKISRRRDMDISTFTAAIYIESVDDTIQDARIAYGAVGPTVVRMRNTEAYLVGQPFSQDTFQRAGDIAVDEITPLTDVRGSSDYRYHLARNVLMKYFFESQHPAINV